MTQIHASFGVRVGIGIGIDPDSDNDANLDWVAGDSPPWAAKVSCHVEIRCGWYWLTRVVGRHARHSDVSDRCELVAVCDLFTENLDAVKESGVKKFTIFRAIIDSVELDALCSAQ